MKSEEQIVHAELQNLTQISFEQNNQKQQLYQCLKGNHSVLLCQNKFCEKLTFICSSTSCQCRIDHLKCLKTSTDQFFYEINKKISPTSSIIQKVDKIIDEAIDYISKIRDNIHLDLQYLGLNQEQKQLMKNINDKQLQQLTGSKIWKVSQGIYQQKQISSNFILKELNKFWTANQNSFKKNFQKLRYLSQKQSPSSLNLFQDSQILKHNTDIQVLLGFFTASITKAKMIYSAKKRKYEMAKFSELCSGVKNNLLLIKSKEGKIFGGFCDLPLSVGLIMGGSTILTKHAFIFSVTNNDKFNFNLGQTALLYNISEGPIFGNNFLGIYKQKRITERLGNNFGGFNAFGNANGNEPMFENAINNPNMGMGFAFGGFANNNFNAFEQRPKQLTQHYCITLQGTAFVNENYKNDEQSRIKLTGNSQKMFPIEQWQVFSVQFDQPLM